jgi:pimeloyl-ACP methyl ester carboxylesterase
MTEHAEPATSTVPSSDGTPIAFERFGSGPPIILVGGALTSALRSFPSFVDLAAVLASRFTVYTYDRRGRGDSGDTQPYAVDREIDDLEALIAKAGGAADVHGLSSGAVLAVAATVRGAAITRLALFEPPLPTGEPDPGSAANPGELIDAGRRGEAVERFLSHGVGLPPQAIAELRHTPEWPRLEALAHTLAYDDAIIGDRMLWTERARSVRVPVLVLDSDASPEHLRVEARMAAETLPTARHRTIAGGVHDAPAEILGAVLTKFFTKA